MVYDLYMTVSPGINVPGNLISNCGGNFSPLTNCIASLKALNAISRVGWRTVVMRGEIYCAGRQPS